MIFDYTNKVIKTFEKHADSDLAIPMAKYMKHRFIYYGIKSPVRKEISATFLMKKNLPKIDEIPSISRQLWDQTQRELQYFTLDLLRKFSRQAPRDSINLYEELITKKSW